VLFILRYVFIFDICCNLLFIAVCWVCYSIFMVVSDDCFVFLFLTQILYCTPSSIQHTTVNRYHLVNQLRKYTQEYTMDPS